MTFRPSSLPASSRISPLAPRNSAKPSFYRRVCPGQGGDSSDWDLVSPRGGGNNGKAGL